MHFNVNKTIVYLEFLVYVLKNGDIQIKSNLMF